MKQSPYSTCKDCPLVDQHIVLGETNCRSLKDVDILILAEAPAVTEKDTGRPLWGQAGRIFRSAMEESGLDQENYFVTNVSLCTNLYMKNGKECTQNPPPEAVECCKPNWNNILDITQPKLILALGGTVAEVMGYGRVGITKKRNKMYKYRDHDVFLTVHPSYVGNNGGIKSAEGKKFAKEFKAVKTILNKPTITQEPFFFKYPEWMFDENLALLDVQRFNDRKEICFVFRDVKTGKKVYHTIPEEDYYHYTGKDPFGDSPMISAAKDVEVVLARVGGSRAYGEYEGDVRTEVKHSIDYRYQRQKRGIPEPAYVPKTMYFDLEVYTYGDKAFPDPKKAKHPINAISFKINDEPTQVFIAELDVMSKDKKVKLPEDAVVKFFSDERSMLVAFFKVIRESEIDVMTGWNVWGFDIPTLFQRMKYNQISRTTFSPIGAAYANVNRYKDFYIGGVYVVDMLELYKELTYQVEASYKLSAIAQKILGKDKVAYEGTLDILFEEDLEKFIEYSKTDTDLLRELDDKLGHIALKSELIKICSTTWKTAEVTTGLIDPLVLSYAKNSGLVCKSAAGSTTDSTIPGAYVRKPRPGLHTWLVDFDYASLYPSIICSCNIGPNTCVARVSEEDAVAFIYNQKDHWKEKKTIAITLDPLKESSKEGSMTVASFRKMIKDNKYIVTAAGRIFKSHDEDISFFYKILRYLLDSRSKYKEQMKDWKVKGDEEKFKYFKNIQMAYKILANSLYGVLANTGFRFFSHDLAISVTLTGQETIKFLGYHVGQYMKSGETKIDPYFMNDYEEKEIPYLLYTDTDSIFLQMGDWLMEKGIL